VSPRFAALARFALDLARQSDGVFDPTLGPLVKLWKFHDGERRKTPPEEAEIAAARARTGWRQVRVSGDGRLTKERAGLELDFNAFAPGFASDEVAGLIAAMGITNCFVEIGGEVRATGRNPNGERWRIGLDQPVPGAEPGARLEGVLLIDEGAVATSGGYRNFVASGKTGGWTHIFDPREGRPVPRPRTSVTVVAPDCRTADALSTTLFVLGPDAGLPWLAKHYPQADALFVAAEDDGRITERPSPGFLRRTGYRRLTAPAAAP
jgi:thiamine biosynthesis lipoprotein